MMKESHSKRAERFPLEDEDEKNAWIVTFSDLMTLLLVFFILLYSISTLNEAKFKKAITSIQISLGEKAPPVALMNLIDNDSNGSKMVSLEDVSGLRPRELDMLQRVQKFVDNQGLSRNIEVSLEQGNVMIRITGTVLFKSGLAQINVDGKPVMDEISNIIKEFSEFKVNIKGHTDNLDIDTRQFPSNWELSAFRATSVLRHLIETGINADRLTATGYADLLPLAPNDTEENRQKNRRVEFVLKKENR